jgi:hypothetical protein
MKATTFQDSNGNESSKRKFGALGFVWFLILIALDGFGFYTLNDTIILAGLGTCAALLGLDSVTSIFKK